MTVKQHRVSGSDHRAQSAEGQVSESDEEEEEEEERGKEIL